MKTISFEYLGFIVIRDDSLTLEQYINLQGSSHVVSESGSYTIKPQNITLPNFYETLAIWDTSGIPFMPEDISEYQAAIAQLLESNAQRGGANEAINENLQTISSRLTGQAGGVPAQSATQAIYVRDIGGYRFYEYSLVLTAIDSVEMLGPYIPDAGNYDSISICVKAISGPAATVNLSDSIKTDFSSVSPSQKLGTFYYMLSGGVSPIKAYGSTNVPLAPGMMFYAQIPHVQKSLQLATKGAGNVNITLSVCLKKSGNLGQTV